MAGQFAVINPRRKRRKKVRTRRKVARRRRRVAVNPVHRRRRHVARRRHNPRRRYARRHNPVSFGGINFVKIGSIAGGFVGTEILAGYLAKMLPEKWTADATKLNIIRIGTKAAVGIGAPMLLKRFLPRGVANALMVGGGVAVLVDAFNTYLKPSLGLADYEQGMIANYEQGFLPEAQGLSGDDSVYGESVY
jgi:hypothetical protein